jgi:archaellum component FlaG (FlaF/FlaG flagellin family)
MRLGARLFTIAGMVLGAIPAIARAQAASVVVAAARRDTALVDSSSAVTVVFRVRNTGTDTVTVAPTLALPRGWEPLTHTAPMRLAPHATELWIAGVHAPQSAPAGTYTVRGSVGTDSDSAFVLVAERRAVDVIALDAPGWILSGGAYTARFLVRNRGNVTTAVALSATSSRGARAIVNVPVVSLAPGGASTVEVREASTSIGGRAQDDIIELAVQDQHDSRTRVSASSRTTVVPPSGSLGDDFARIPAVVTLRAARSALGISPATISGHGTLPGSNTTIDLAAHAPTSGRSLLGEREELRFRLNNGGLSLRAGDGVYGYSLLTSNGALGFGAQFDRTGGALEAGGYVQHSRWLPNAPYEVGTYVGTPRENASRLGLIAVGRGMAGAAAGVLGFDGALPLSKAATIGLESAVSDSNGMPSAAERAHLDGVVGRLTYDVSHEWAGTAFAGPQRGIRSNDVSLSAQAWKQLSFHAYGSRHATGPTRPSSTSPLDRFESGSMGATLGAWGTVDYVWTTRSDETDSLVFDGEQRGARVTTFLPAGPFSVSLNVDRGTATQTGLVMPRDYFGYGGTFNARLPRGGALSFFAQQSDGNALGGDGRPSLTAGANIDLQLGGSVRARVVSSASSMQPLFAGGNPIWYGQVDGRLDYRLPNTATIGVRGHAWINPGVQGATANNAVYLEVRMPVGVPVGRLRRLGRVEGQVADASGRPLAGVLVHIGDQLAVTNARGQVSVSGLPTGEHPISLDVAGIAGQAMLVGDLSVVVDGSSSRPATFKVGMARGATLRGQVRVLDFATTLAANGDSLVQVGTLPNVTVALEGARDTLYQTSDDAGRLDFGSVTPGRWTISVLPGAELPDRHAFASERLSVVLDAGEKREVTLEIVPRKRPVTFVGPGEILKPRQDPKAKQDQRRER